MKRNSSFYFFFDLFVSGLKELPGVNWSSSQIGVPFAHKSSKKSGNSHLLLILLGQYFPSECVPYFERDDFKSYHLF
jgi:hypothetical protein